MELQLDDHIRWIGFVREQAQIYSQLDAVVMPSRFEEPFGMSAVEAAAFGRAVICSAKGGLPEIVESGVTGLIVEADDVGQLAQAISTMVRNRAFVERMGAAARSRAKANFSSEAFGDRFIQALRPNRAPTPLGVAARPA